MRTVVIGILTLVSMAGVSEPKAAAARRPGTPQPRKLVIATGADPILESVDWSPNGRELACRLRENAVVFVDSRTGKPTRKPWNFTKPLVSFAPAPDWKQAAVVDAGGRVRLWDVSSRRGLRVLPGITEPDGVAWSPDGRRLATTKNYRFLTAKPKQGGFYPLEANRANRVLIFDTGTGRLQHSLRHASRDGALEGHDFDGFEAAWSLDGRRLATVLIRSGRMRESPVHLWDARTGGLVHQWGRLRSRVRVDESTDCFNAPAWSPDGKLLAATDGNRLWIWDTRTGRLVRLLALGRPVQQIAWSPDGRTLAARTFPDYWGEDEGYTARIYLWDGRTQRPIRTLSVPDRSLYDMAWSPDSHYLAAAGRDGIVRIWDF